MTILIFDEIQYPEVDQPESTELTLVTVDGLMMPEGNGIPLDTQEKLDGIELGFEAIAALERIKSILSNKTLDKTTLKLSRIAFEDIKNQVGIYNDGTLISMECFTNDTVALEGFTAFIEAIWDAIVRTFKAIWESIRSLFGSSEIKAKEKQAEEIVKDYKTPQTEKAPAHTGHEAPPILSKVEVSGFQTIAKHFQYLGDKIKVADLISEIGKIRKSILGCEEMLKALEVANMNMDVAVDRFQTVGIDEKSLNFFETGNAAYYDAILDNLAKSEDLGSYKKELDEKLSIDYHSVDRQSVRNLDGLSRGSKVFAFHLKEHDEDTACKFLFLNNVNSETNASVTLDEEYTSQELIVLGECLADTLKELREFKDLYQSKSTRMINMQNGTLKKMQAFIEKGVHAGENVNSGLKFFQLVVRSLQKATITLSTFDSALQQSLLDHSDMNTYLYKKWKAASVQTPV